MSLFIDYNYVLVKPTRINCFIYELFDCSIKLCF